jgi:ketosteroid isomerase-like protein
MSGILPAVSNEDVLRGHYDATNRRAWDVAMSAYDDHVVLVAPAGPEGGAYYGKEAVGRWFGDWMRAFRGGVKFEDLRVERGEDGLALQARQIARGGESGVELTQQWFWSYSFRRGKIARVDIHLTLEDALAAAGVETP